VLGGYQPSAQDASIWCAATLPAVRASRRQVFPESSAISRWVMMLTVRANAP
jgi:hypothetical protein